MKTSNKILLAIGAIPLLCVFVFVLVLKMMPLGAKVSDDILVDKSSWTTKTIPIKNFNNISTIGLWEIHLVQADGYLVEIKAPKEIMEMVSIEKDDQTLKLNNSPIPSQSKNYTKIEVLIHTPGLSEIITQGSSDLYFQELTVDSLTIHTNGFLKLSGTDSSIENLSFACNGMSKIDLSETKVANANVQCDGIFKMDLLMNGGDLKGRLNGIGTLFCQGEIKRNQIQKLSPFVKFVWPANWLEPPEPPMFQ